MLQFESVSFGYDRERRVIDDLSFTISDGESVGLIGANGAGKSTLIKLLLGLLSGEGRIFVDELPVEKRNLPEIRRRVGVLLQNSDNQMFMPTVLEDLTFGPLNYGLSRTEAERRADEVLARLGIPELKHRHNHKLSGGEKRMAALATVLAMEPDVLLLDEPTNALDPYNRRLVIRTIRSLPNTKLIASHDLDMILDTCSRVLLLSNGRLIADGPAQTVLRNRALLEANRMELPLRFSEAAD